MITNIQFGGGAIYQINDESGRAQLATELSGTDMGELLLAFHRNQHKPYHFEGSLEAGLSSLLGIGKAKASALASKITKGIDDSNTYLTLNPSAGGALVTAARKLTRTVPKKWVLEPNQAGKDMAKRLNRIS